MKYVKKQSKCQVIFYFSAFWELQLLGDKVKPDFANEQAINAYNTITVSPEFRELERLSTIAKHNEAPGTWSKLVSDKTARWLSEVEATVRVLP